VPGDGLAMAVDLYDENRHVWTGTLAEFLADNAIEDGCQIETALEAFGVYTGGGGAQPLWTLKRLERTNDGSDHDRERGS
jgi:hypothetical protein